MGDSVGVFFIGENLKASFGKLMFGFLEEFEKILGDVDVLFLKEFERIWGVPLVLLRINLTAKSPKIFSNFWKQNTREFLRKN